jgi:hypothetical protein
MYGILNLLLRKMGRPAMKRVLEIIKKYPEARPVRSIKGWPESPFMPTESLRLGAAEGLAEGSSRYLDPYPGTFMNYVRHKVPNRKMFKDLANYYRLNPEKRAVMDDWHQEMGSKGWWSQGFMDNMLRDAGKNLKTRGPTEHEKYLLALLRQKRQEANKGAKILQFPKRD